MKYTREQWEEIRRAEDRATLRRLQALSDTAPTMMRLLRRGRECGIFSASPAFREDVDIVLESLKHVE